MPDDEYRAVVRAARRRGRPVAQIVRESLRQALAIDEGVDPDKRIAAVLAFARFSGPTGNIEDILEEIERGRGLS
jgi:hypothetical protein